MRNGSGTDQDRRERRRYKRTHVLMAGELVSAKRGATKGFVLDISANGAQIQFAEPLVPDSEITLKLAETVNLGVEVAWRSHNRLGLRFRALPNQISSIFAGLLSEDCLAGA
jgi:hypothetical protein